MVELRRKRKVTRRLRCELLLRYHNSACDVCIQTSGTMSSSLFWCYAALMAVSYRGFLTAPSSHLQGSSRPAILDCSTLKKRSIGYPETSVSNYQSRLGNNPEERRPLLHRGGSLNHASHKISFPLFSVFSSSFFLLLKTW